MLAYAWHAPVIVLWISFALLLCAIPVFAQAAEDGPGAEIVTGDAVSSAGIDNEVNTNTVNATSTPADLAVENDNDAAIENTTEACAVTGENTASDNPGSASVETGDAIAHTTILNVVNSNFINAVGLFLFLSNIGMQIDGLDLRQLSMFQEGGENASSCGVLCVLWGGLFAANENDATVENTSIVRSSTGENETSYNEDGSIRTGNAYAVADVMNVVNTNIVDSQYLLMTFNNFGSWDGDVVFPPAQFFARLFMQGGMGQGNANIENSNAATVENTIETEAETGQNEANENGESGAVRTGHAYAGVNAVNQVNQNIFANVSFSVLFRVSGNWSGSVFGLPEGMVWEQTPHGIALYTDPFALPGGSGAGSSGDRDIANDNAAAVSNNIHLYALTGINRANNNNTVGTVATGDAFAVANVVNVVNTNVVGRNWILAIVNILGDWSGSISFGKPDLWVAEHAEVPRNPVEPGDAVTYNITVTNNGDATATNVRLADRFNGNMLRFIESSGGGWLVGDNEVVWNIRSLEPGGSIQVSYRAAVHNDIPFGEIPLTNTISVNGREKDENSADNTDEMTLLAFNPPPRRPIIINDAPPDLHIMHANSASRGTLNTNSTADYTITVKNENASWSAYNAVLVQTLEDPSGRVVDEQQWRLGKVFPLEEVRVSYSTTFGSETAPGVYTSRVRVVAQGGGSAKHSYDASSDEVVSLLTIVRPR